MTEVHHSREKTLVKFDKLFLNNITHLGKLNYHEARPSLGPHTHKDALEICFVYRGNPVFLIGDKEYPLHGGDVFLSFPNELHSTGNYPEDKMILYWMGIKIENSQGNFLHFYNKAESSAFLQALQSLDTRVFKGTNKLKSLMDEVISLYFMQHEFRNILIRNRITDFLVTIIDCEKKSTFKGISSKMQSSIHYIEEHIEENISLEYLSDQANLSLSRFKQRFKDELGIPPGEFIMRAKVKESCQLLIHSEREITDIAFDFGFSSSQYFATVFKKYTSLSPSAYRKRQRVSQI